jgi:hypothetical protein
MKAALWVLDRFLSSRHRDAIAGDIVERRGDGASNWWGWRQVVGAIAIDTFTQLRTRPLQVIGAACVGWLTIQAYVRLVAVGLQPVQALLSAHPGDHSCGTALWVGLPAVALGFYVSGWIVARLQGVPAVLVYAVSESVWNTVWNVSTWHDVSLALMVAMAPVMVMFQLLRVFTLAGGIAGSRRCDASERPRPEST